VMSRTLGNLEDFAPERSSFLDLQQVKNREQHDLCEKDGTAIEQNIAQRTRARFQIALMPLIEDRYQGRAQERNRSPLQTPSRAKPRKSRTPGAKQKNTQREVTNKVSDLAKEGVPRSGPCRIHSE